MGPKVWQIVPDELKLLPFNRFKTKQKFHFIVNILLISQNEHNIITFMQIIFCVMFYVFFLFIYFFSFVFCLVMCLFVQLYNQNISSYFHLVQVVADIEDRMVIFAISWCCISVLFVICNRSS